uniref:Rho-GAP domain-containing protein n=1 Tax=Arcella intermedia TaxID=1963864 RepID=A0A6B2LDB3_9EUKA
MYLRELPEGLILSRDFSSYCLLGSYQEVDIEAIAQLISTLPATNKLVLQKLLHLLFKISLKNEINKMTPANLAVCLATNVLKSGTNESSLQSVLENAASSQRIFQLMIVEYSNIFAKVVME